MVKLMVVAGDKTDNLVSFFKEQGTFEITCSYNNFTDNADDLQSKIIRADKLLYVYPLTADGTPVMNIKSDMQLLRNALLSDGFFSVGEIIFLSNNSDVAKDATRFFKTVLQDCRYTNYSIKLLDSVLTFPAIYNSIMGVSEAKDFRNSYTQLVRVERNAEATLAYTESDDSNLILEPFSYSALSEYESQKKLTVKLDSGNLHKDAADQEVTELDSPDFGRIHYDKAAMRRRILLVSGKSKSGKSTWTTMLALSALAAGHKVCVFDFTKSSKITGMLGKSKHLFRSASMQDFLLGDVLTTDDCVVCTAKNFKEQCVVSEFLSNVLGSNRYELDTVLICLDDSDVVSVSNALGDIAYCNLITAVPVMADVLQALDTLADVGTDRKYVVLDECVKTMDDDTFLSADTVKGVVGDAARVVKHCNFTKYEVGPAIYQAVVR